MTTLAMAVGAVGAGILPSAVLMSRIVEPLGWTLVHFAWQGLLVGAGSAIVLRVLHGARPQVRYALACVSLLVMIVAPLSTFAMLTAKDGDAAASAAAATSTVVAPSASSATSMPSATLAASVTPATSATSTTSATAAADASCAALPALASSTAARKARAASATPPLSLTLLTRLATSLLTVQRALPWLVSLWCLGVLLLLLRLLGGIVLLGRLTHATRPATDDWQLRLIVLARRLRLRRAIALRESASAHTPAVIGWLRPVILLPTSVLAGLSPDQVEAILVHELAHIRRHDYIVNLLQSVAETLLFYHPAVWFISRQIRVEREHCCDDVAVDVCGDPVVYVEALADLERLRGSLPSPALAATGGPLLRRVKRLLEPTPQTSYSWPAAAALVLGVAAVGFVTTLHGDTPAQAGRRASTSTTTVADARQRPRATRPASQATDDELDALFDTPAPPEPPAPPAPGSVPAVPAVPPAPAMASTQFVAVPPAPAAPPVPAAEAMADLPEPGPFAPAPAAHPAPMASPTRPVGSPMPAAAPAPMQAMRGAPPAAAPAPMAGPLPTPPEPPTPMAPMARPAVAPAPPEPMAPAAPSSQAATPPRPPAPPAARSIPAEPVEAPLPPPPPPRPPRPSSTVRSSSWFGWLWGEDQSRSSYTISDKSGRRLAVLTRGAIELTDDDGDVKQIEEGGYLKVEERSGGTRRRVEIRSTGSQLQRRWLKNGAEADYDAEAAQWLARTLRELGQRTGLGAEKRITRILTQRGPAGLLEASTAIQSDYVKRMYLEGVISSPALDTPTMTRVLDQTATMSSSYERCEVLRAVAARGMVTDDARMAYVRATVTMSSDYERRRALEPLLKTPLTSPVLTTLLTSAGKISSDYELAELLTKVSDTQTLDATSAAQFVTTTRTIHSDYEHRRALLRFAERPALSADLQQAVLSSATTIHSDYEAAELLCALSKTTPIAEAARPAFFTVIDTLQSDYERGRALKAFIKGGGRLPDASVRSVITSTLAMHSDFEAANVLLELASTQSLAGDSRQEFVRAAERMSSQHERERTLVSLVRQDGTTPR